MILNKIEERLLKLENNILNRVEDNVKKIETLDKKCDDNEQYYRLNNLNIYGVKESEENIENVVIQL